MTNPSIRNRNSEEKVPVERFIVLEPSDLKTPGNIKKKVLEIPANCKIKEISLVAIEAIEPATCSISVEDDSSGVSLLNFVASTSTTSETNPQRAGNIVSYNPSGRRQWSGTGLNLAIDPTTEITAGKLGLMVSYLDTSRSTGHLAQYIAEPGETSV